jgi:uncharacterized repeat protein (TIGR03803 family)
MNPESFMKTIVKQMMLTLAALLLAAASGSAQVLSLVYSFNTNDAVAQTEGLLLSGNTLYGTALAPDSGGKSGGAGPSGAVFKLNTDGTGFTNLFIFGFAGNPYLLTNTDGATPEAELVLSGNTLYGTTIHGGFYTEGVVFAVNTDGTGFTNLHNFTSTVQNSAGFLTNSDGANPFAALVLSGSTLFGTTDGGGSFGVGTVFAIHTDGTGFTNLHSFFGGTNEGANPQGSLILSGNTLYGTTISGGGGTSSGGGLGNGTVFALNTDGTDFTNLHSFSSLVHETNSPFAYTNSDGTLPQSGLVLSGNVLYGTAKDGGSFGEGTVFAVTTDGTDFTDLHSFNGSDGVGPVAGLVLSGNTLYGTTFAGGSLSHGTVFAINTDGTDFATLNTFTPITYDSPLNVYTNAGGASPVGNLILSGSTLYGATELGGTNGIGTVFTLNLAAAPPTIQFTASPTNGVPPVTVQFRSPTNDGGGNAILAWNWNFGDGTTNSTAQTPSHVYTNAGTFFPTLMCINNNGDPVMGSGPAIVSAYPHSILNGGFETGNFTNWTRSGGNGSGVATGSTYAHTGTYGAALEAGTQGFLSQTLATTPGANYLISFWLDSPAATKPNDFRVSWNGNVLLDKTNLTAIGWTNIQLTVTATATNTSLQFGYLNGSFYFGLDDISVTPVTHPNLASVSLSGTNLVLNGINGVSGTTNYLLMGTNLAQPLSQWKPVVTNVLGASGNFTIIATNAVDSKAAGRFYILRLQ